MLSWLHATRLPLAELVHLMEHVHSEQLNSGTAASDTSTAWALATAGLTHDSSLLPKGTRLCSLFAVCGR